MRLLHASVRPAACALAALVLLSLAPSRAEAQATDSTVIFACYVPGTGTVYRIKAPGLPDACEPAKGGRPAGVPFSWNQEGLAGPAGVAGPQGPVGPQGPAGAGSSLEPVLLFSQINIAIDPAAVQTFRQSCPAGRRVIDKGYLLLDTSGNPLTTPGVQVIGDEVSAPSPSAFDRSLPETQSRNLMIVNSAPKNAQVRMQLTCAIVR